MNEIINGDCLEVLKKHPDNHFTTIITDPPYGLSFMGKKWDYDVPSIDIWKECLRVLKTGGTMLCFAGSRTQHRMACNVEDAGFLIKDCLMWIYGSGFPKSTDISKQFSGYGTALKPAYEPIIMAMKPNDGSYANNALKHGVAGINIDAGRIAGIPESPGSTPPTEIKGRFPANIILDEEVTNEFWNRFFYCAKASKSERNAGCEELEEKQGIRTNAPRENETIKTPKRNNNHPTVKPLKLMEYLINLIMPPKDGLLLDPFAGSGSTIIAAKKLGFNAVGIEKESEYCQIAAKRIDNIQNEVFEEQFQINI